MASLSFEAEDQTDEDFFDKLVNDDDDDLVAPVPTRTGSDDIDDTKVFSNLGISERTEVVDSGIFAGSGLEAEKVFQDDVGLVKLNNHEDGAVDKESDIFLHSSLSENVNMSSEVGIGKEDGLDSAMAKNGLASGQGVKVVQWSSFGSDLRGRSGSGVGSGSYSDFFNEFGDNSDDPFTNVGNMENSGIESTSMDGVLGNAVAGSGSFTHGQHHGSGSDQNAIGQDLTSSQYWENLYPGWQYDPSTGQWHQVEELDVNRTPNVNTLQSCDANTQLVTQASVIDQTSDAHRSRLTVHSVVTNVTQGYATDAVSNCKLSLQGSTEYPAHMVFDPQYPGWFYDTIVQEWKSLDSYTLSASQSASTDYNQQYQNRSTEGFESQIVSCQDYVTKYVEPMSSFNQENTNAWETPSALKNEATIFTGSQQLGNQNGSINHLNSSMDQQANFNTSESVISYEMPHPGFDSNIEVPGVRSFNHTEQFIQNPNQTMMAPSQHVNFSPTYLANQKSISFNQNLPESGSRFSYSNTEGRSSVGRPPHALVTFGFGGKLIVMKNYCSFQTNSTYEGKGPMGGVVNVLNLMEVVMDKTDTSSFGLGVDDYFHSLCQQCLPGPLVGGSVGSKELNRWIDDQIRNCESPYYRNGETMRLLFSLLKISCQYFGKLRLPFGADQGLKESDCPESAVAKLFASAKGVFSQPNGYQSHTHCLQNFPSEAQIQATALEVQKLLVSGQKKEALECAREGQLWGPALVLASQLGDQFYGDTVKQMALKQVVSGSPLRTLCLLIAGNPADVFSDAGSDSNIPVPNAYQPPGQIRANGMLDQWEENLAIITANKTKGDEFVIIHLGDSLWKERGEVAAAHLCYLVAEVNIETYSDGARICLVGADHWKFPRTYASPAAIQRTELYEYSKVLGNSQFLLLPFQPYKLIYAYMLAEVGKVTDSLKYCQAILKPLRTNRAPEVDTWLQLVSSLEERLRIHQQGGFGDNLAPKLMGKLLNLFDSTAQRVVGGLPPPVPLTSHSSLQHSEHHHQSGALKAPSSQPTMAVPSLVPSASMEPISEWGGESNQPSVPNRSISEPDFGTRPRKVHPAKEANSSYNQDKASMSNRSSRFGRFGSQLFQKTVGLVLRSRPDRQAKLGERNKFYYDEKLKRWVEEGTEPPKEEVALPPPPTTAAFQVGTPNHNGMVGESETESIYSHSGPEHKSPISSEQSLRIPPMPPSSNQFSARGRMGVRARYVDTFNKGGGTPTSLFQSPPVPATKPVADQNPKFFIPTPVASAETAQKTAETTEEAVASNETPTPSLRGELLPSPLTTTSSSTTMHRYPSMDNIVQKQKEAKEDDHNSVPPPSRRVASWSGSLGNISTPKTDQLKPSGGALGLSPLSFTQADHPPSQQFSASSSDLGEELQEVQL